MIPEPASRYYAGAVTLALGHLHTHGFIYRDLKPENLLLDAKGYLKVCDLGLAKRTERTYTLVGTPQYLAPELLRGDGATKDVDWYDCFDHAAFGRLLSSKGKSLRCVTRVPVVSRWALGILVFEMLNGELPFETADVSS